MSDDIHIEPAEGVWVVRAAGAVIAETRAAKALVAGASGPVIYFPREDIAMLFLDTSPRNEDVPGRGPTEYFHVSTPGGHVEDAGWSHTAPDPAVALLVGHVAFDASRVAVERV